MKKKEVGKFDFLKEQVGVLEAVIGSHCSENMGNIYSNHLNTWILNSMGVWYSNSKVKWLGQPFKYRTFWNINRLFLSDFQSTIQMPDHLTTGHKSTIWKPDKCSIRSGYFSNFSASAFNILLTLSRVFDFLTFSATIPPDQSPSSNVVTSGCGGVSSAISFARKMELRAIFVLTTERSQTK